MRPGLRSGPQEEEDPLRDAVEHRSPAGEALPPSRPTSALAEALGLRVHAEALDTLAAEAPPELVEWSVNPRGDNRGRLRATLWSEDLAAANRLRARLLPTSVRDALEGLPEDGMVGYGFAWSPQGRAARWYQLPSMGRGGALAQAAAARFPELAEPARLLAERCGGWAQCQGLGLEADEAGLRRATIYYRLKGPEVLLELLTQQGIPASPRARLLIEGVMGVSRATPRPWPKAWIARSVGDGGGWKLYYFARRDPLRAPDEALLDAVEASAALRAARDRLAALCPPVAPKLGAAGLVQLLGLRLGDERPPTWTVYLAPR